MEVDAHPPRDRDAAGGMALATAEVTVIKGEANSRFSKVSEEDRLRLSRPQRYDGGGDAQILDEFFASPRTYPHVYTENEEQTTLSASCVLEGKTSRIDDVAALVQALLGRFTPSSAWK